MRESNFAFPTQGRACVCISSQLYDRRALDSTSSLPLFNSLTHLTYLTSTSPRIREILTLDGGLERLVRLLREFCSGPPPPIPVNRFYGLLPLGVSERDLYPTPNGATTFDRAAAVRFSLAFQCVVNIGVRGSEAIRGRVVQAGMLDVVSAVLEAWLVAKGFAIGPSATGSGAPREPREVRVARRQELMDRRQRDQAIELARALRRQVAATTSADAPSNLSRERRPGPSHRDHHALSPVPTSSGSGSSSRNSGDEASPDGEHPVEEGDSHLRRPGIFAHTPSFASSTSSTSRPSDETFSADTSAIVTPLRSTTPTGAVVINGRDRSGTVVARPLWDARADRPSMDTDIQTGTEESEPRMTDARARAVAVVDDGDVGLEMIVGGIGNGLGMGIGGVEEGLVTLDQNDDLAMGAPPGAPGAFGNLAGGATPRPPPDLTPRAALVALAPSHGSTVDATPIPRPAHPGNTNMHTPTIVEATAMVQRALDLLSSRTAMPPNENSPINPNLTPVNASGLSQPANEGPYRDEDVLLSLQLLAYLSKYPHVRQAFYRPRPPKASPPTITSAFSHGTEFSDPSPKSPLDELVPDHSSRAKPETFIRGLNLNVDVATARDTRHSQRTIPTSPTPNVFTLVERFTFRPSPSEPNLPRLPHDIQYWAAVIMRNACRKDEARGGIRQCANMTCGKWETFPREFAKCRRCRKAKYCGKECQSRAWAQGHRFWCSAREAEEGMVDVSATAASSGADGGDQNPNGALPATASRRERHHHHRDQNPPAGAADAPLNHDRTAIALLQPQANFVDNRAQLTRTPAPPRVPFSLAPTHHVHPHQAHAHHHHHHHAPPGYALPQHPPQMHNTIVRVGGPRVARAAAGGGLIATVVRQRPVDGNPGTELQSGSPGPSTDRSRRRAETVPGASLPVGLPSEHDEFREHPPPQLGFAAAPTAGIRDHSRQNFGVFGAVPPVVEGARTGEALLRIVGMAAHDGPVGQGDDQMLLD